MFLHRDNEFEDLVLGLIGGQAVYCDISDQPDQANRNVWPNPVALVRKIIRRVE